MVTSSEPLLRGKRHLGLGGPPSASSSCPVCQSSWNCLTGSSAHFLSFGCSGDARPEILTIEGAEMVRAQSDDGSGTGLGGAEGRRAPDC